MFRLVALPSGPASDRAAGVVATDIPDVDIGVFGTGTCASCSTDMAVTIMHALHGLNFSVL